jgi:NTP pyrophosphatase (non-canonical NTP hydrolase)
MKGFKMHEKYLRDDPLSRLAHVVEECGELLSAIAKAQRFGLDSVNPELPGAEQETNRHWINREADDVLAAITRIRDL